MLGKPAGTEDDDVANCSDDDLSNVDESCISSSPANNKTTDAPKDDVESSDGDIDEGLDNVAPTTTPRKNQES